MSDVNSANIPGAGPMVDSEGKVTQPWYLFFLALLNRTGGTGTPTDITTLQEYAESIDMEANTAVPVQPKPILNTDGFVVVQKPPAPDFSQNMVYQPPGSYLLPSNFAALAAVLATKTSAQSLTTGTYNVITGYTTAYDANGNLNAATGIFTAPATGNYAISAQITFGASMPASTVCQVLLYLNGALLIAGDARVGNASTGGQAVAISVPEIRLSAGDQLTVRGFQNSGSTIALTTAPGFNFVSIKQSL